MIRAAIFDLDDTLLDSRALFEARERRDWAVVMAGLDSVVPFEVAEDQPAITSLPKAAHDHGLAVGIFTHSPEPYADALLRRHKIKVDEMVTGSDRLPPKPDPTGLITVARTLQIDPTECVYIGDSVADFGAAAAAGMVSIGVCWDQRIPDSWRHGWPDIAVDRPSRLLEALEGGVGLGPIGEAAATGEEPIPHWGSLLQLGGNTLGLGRYFQWGDRRYAEHALSRLIIDAKEEQARQEDLAQAFGALEALRFTNAPALIASVPPAPDDPGDRFTASRAALAAVFDAGDAEGLLTMKYAVEDYKRVPRDQRTANNRDRFEATRDLEGERIILIDDVLTSGSQAGACREALAAAGAGGVTILVAGIAQNPLPEPCPRCGEEYGGQVKVKRNSHTGEQFRGCSRYWQGCRWSADL
jgi:HAD superfamily hydrolase (TIGR01549 family)